MGRRLVEDVALCLAHVFSLSGSLLLKHCFLIRLADQVWLTGIQGFHGFLFIYLLLLFFFIYTVAEKQSSKDQEMLPVIASCVCVSHRGLGDRAFT